MSMVQAGTATDAVIDEIVPHLDAGDVLIEISARVLAKTDEATGKPLIDVILDAADEVQV